MTQRSKTSFDRMPLKLSRQSRSFLVTLAATMNTLRAALVPGLISGLLSIFASWFWMGFVFHSYQRATPETWRVEGSRNYFLSSLVRMLSAIAIAVVYVLIARFHVAFFSDGIAGALRFAAVIWIAFAAPVAIEAAIYIRLHSMVVLGQVLDWLTTAVITCVVTAFWLGRGP
jgi:hypothetical protein